MLDFKWLKKKVSKDLKQVKCIKTEQQHAVSELEKLNQLLNPKTPN